MQAGKTDPPVTDAIRQRGHHTRSKRADLLDPMSGPPIAQAPGRRRHRSMRGVITNKDVVRNLGLIFREFGAGCFLRCLWVVATRRSTTFLEVVAHHR
jgi:hypothetical protein